jgi:hypothetical protein
VVSRTWRGREGLKGGEEEQEEAEPNMNPPARMRTQQRKTKTGPAAPVIKSAHLWRRMRCVDQSAVREEASDLSRILTSNPLKQRKTQGARPVQYRAMLFVGYLLLATDAWERNRDGRAFVVVEGEEAISDG